MIAPDVGGGFGSKIFSSIPRSCSWCGWRCRLEAPGAMDRDPLREHGEPRPRARSSPTDHDRRGCDGTRQLAYRLEIIQDAGAYSALGTFLPMFTRTMLTGTYDIEEGRSATPCRSSPTPPRSWPIEVRVDPEAAAAIERALDLFAAEIFDGPRRGAAAQPGHGHRPLPFHDPHGHCLRHRRLREGARDAPCGRRLRRAASRTGDPGGCRTSRCS